MSIVPSKSDEESVLEKFHSEACHLLQAQRAILGRDREDLTPLSPTNRGALLLGNLLWQIRNGGWSQWCRNGYLALAARMLPGFTTAASVPR